MLPFQLSPRGFDAGEVQPFEPSQQLQLLPFGDLLLGVFVGSTAFQAEGADKMG